MFNTSLLLALITSSLTYKTNKPQFSISCPNKDFASQCNVDCKTATQAIYVSVENICKHIKVIRWYSTTSNISSVCYLLCLCFYGIPPRFCCYIVLWLWPLMVSRLVFSMRVTASKAPRFATLLQKFDCFSFEKLLIIYKINLHFCRRYRSNFYD